MAIQIRATDSCDDRALPCDRRSGVAAPGKAPKSASAAGAGGGGRKGGAAAVLAPGQIKWLKGSGVDDVKLVNLSWAKLVAPDKKGGPWFGGLRSRLRECCSVCTGFDGFGRRDSLRVGYEGGGFHEGVTWTGIQRV
jgi:hypothetical protein